MTVEEMKKKKTELGFSCEQISDRSGVPLGTVQKIFSGITKRPRYDTIWKKHFRWNILYLQIILDDAAAERRCML